jgi:hypothetical protein
MKNKQSGFTYLACPYSHPEQEVRDWRVQQVLKATANLMNDGWLVFSPIGHTYQLEPLLKPELGQSHDFWMKQDIALLRHASSLTVLMLPGWLQSTGVDEEIHIAKMCNIPIFYISGEVLH